MITERYDDKVSSFAHCSNFTITRQRTLRAGIAFDHDFVQTRDNPSSQPLLRAPSSRLLAGT